MFKFQHMNSNEIKKAKNGHQSLLVNYPFLSKNQSSKGDQDFIAGTSQLNSNYFHIAVHTYKRGVLALSVPSISEHFFFCLFFKNILTRSDVVENRQKIKKKWSERELSPCIRSPA